MAIGFTIGIGVIGFYFYFLVVLPAIEILAPRDLFYWMNVNFVPAIGSLVLTVAGVFYVTRFIPALSWYWFPDMSDYKKPEKEPKKLSAKMAETDLKQEVTQAFKTYAASKHLDTDHDGFAVPRAFPKGTQIDEISVDVMRLSLPAARKWWVWLPFATPTALLLLVVIPLGGYWGIIEGSYNNSGRYTAGYWTPLPAIGLLIVTFFITYSIWKWVFPRLTFTIRSDSITVNGTKYKPELSNGLRVGYKIEGKADALSDGASISPEGRGVGFKSLRYSYGQWGEDLPFAVNAYHAVEYVNWINQMTKQFNAPKPKENAPEQGRKTAEF